jgi:CRP/FNR family cyclic AMP-dependent transcriptional regulator
MNISLIKQVPLFKSFQPEDSRRIADLLKDHYLKKGSILFRKGDEGEALYMIIEGKIKISVTSRFGNEVILAVLSDGDFFGEMALLDGLPRSADAVANEDTHLLVLSRSEFLSFIIHNETAAMSIIFSLTQRLRKADDFLADTCFLNIGSRLAKKLLELAEIHGQQEGDTIQIKLVLTQSDLASMVGATRESINKELKKLRDKGLVTKQGRMLMIHNLERLKRRVRS